MLSAVASGKKILSVKSAIKISKNLGFSSLECRYFILLSMLQETNEPQALNRIEAELESVRLQGLMKKHTISDKKTLSHWATLAIIELFELLDRNSNAKEISTILKLSSKQTLEAIEFLCKYGVLEKINKSEYQLIDSNIGFYYEGFSEDLRKYYFDLVKTAKNYLPETDKTPPAPPTRVTYLGFCEEDMKAVAIETDLFLSKLRRISDKSSGAKRLYAGIYTILPISEPIEKLR